MNKEINRKGAMQTRMDFLCFIINAIRLAENQTKT